MSHATRRESITIDHESWKAAEQPAHAVGLDSVSIGESLRAEREARKVSVRELARRLGVSPSLISQIERGLTLPSVSTLYAMVNELEISVDELFAGASGSGYRPPRVASGIATAQAGHVTEGGSRTRQAHDPRVVRADEGQSIQLGSGVRWERLTPDSDPEVDFLHAVYEVGGSSSEGGVFVRHAGKEYGRVIEGRLGVTVGFDTYELGPGDSISFDSTTPHRLWNLGDTPVHVVWFVMGRRGDSRMPGR